MQENFKKNKLTTKDIERGLVNYISAGRFDDACEFLKNRSGPFNSLALKEDGKFILLKLLQDRNPASLKLIHHMLSKLPSTSFSAEVDSALLLDWLILHRYSDFDQEFINNATIKTLKETGHKYQYTLTPEAAKKYKEHYSLHSISEFFAFHHEKFNACLWKKPDLIGSFKGKNNPLDFWLVSFDQAQIYQKIAPKALTGHIEKNPKKLEDKDKKIAAYERFEADSVPDMASYMRSHVLQKPVLKQIHSIVVYEAFALAASFAHDINVRENEYKHQIYTGNPGVGKTSIARVFGRFCKDNNRLSSGHVIATTANKILANYVGQTSERLRSVAELAEDGVLFIDEAYKFAGSGYGDDAVTELLDITGDKNRNMVVILAGYHQNMQNLLEMNPGLDRRFPNRIDIPDFTSVEIEQILDLKLQAMQIQIEPQAKLHVLSYVEKMRKESGMAFGNAGLVENIIHKCLICHSINLNMAGKLNLNFMDVAKEQLLYISAQDAEDAIAEMQSQSVAVKTKARAGFIRQEGPSGLDGLYNP